MSYKITNCTFSSSRSLTNGGAIALSNMPNVEISSTTIFNNSAKVNGGAIFFYCDNFGLNYEVCSLKIKNTTFKGNRADQEGGAIKWNFYEPQMSGINFVDNKAGIYGDNIAAVAKKLVQVTLDDAL